MDFSSSKGNHRQRVQLYDYDAQPDVDDSSQREESELLSVCSNNKATNEFLRRPLTKSGCDFSKCEHPTLRPINSAPAPQYRRGSSERKQRSERTHSSPRPCLPPVSSHRPLGHDWRRNVDDIFVGSKPTFVRGKLDYPVNKAPCFNMDECAKQSPPKVVACLKKNFNEPERMIEPNEDQTMFTPPTDRSEFSNAKSTSLLPSLVCSPETDINKYDGSVHSYRSTTCSADMNSINMYGDGLNYTILPVSHGGSSSPPRPHVSRTSHAALNESRKSSSRTSPSHGSKVSRPKHHTNPRSGHASPKRRGGNDSDVSSSSTLHGLDNLEDELHHTYNVYTTVKSINDDIPSRCWPDERETTHKIQSAREGTLRANSLKTSTVTNSFHASEYKNVISKKSDIKHGQNRSTPTTIRYSNGSPTVLSKVPVPAQHCHPKLKGAGSSNKSRFDSKSPRIVVPVHSKSPRGNSGEVSANARKSVHNSCSDADKCVSSRHSSISVKTKSKEKLNQEDVIKKVDDLLRNVYISRDVVTVNDRGGSPVSSHSHYSLRNVRSVNQSPTETTETTTTTSGDVSGCTFSPSPHWDDDDVVNHASLVAAIRDTDVEVEVETVYSPARRRRRARTSEGDSFNVSPRSVVISPSYQDVSSAPLRDSPYMWESSVEPTVEAASHEYKDTYTTVSDLTQGREILSAEPLQPLDEAIDSDVCILKENIAKYAEPFRESPSSIKSPRSLKSLPTDTFVWDMPPKYVKAIRNRSISPANTRVSPRQPQRRYVQSAICYGNRPQTHVPTDNRCNRELEARAVTSKLANHTRHLQPHEPPSSERPEKHVLSPPHVASYGKNPEKLEARATTSKLANHTGHLQNYEPPSSERPEKHASSPPHVPSYGKKTEELKARTATSKLANHTRHLQTHEPPSSERPEKEVPSPPHVANYDKENEDAKLSQNSSHSQLHVNVKNEGRSKICSTSSEMHTREYEAGHSCKPDRREHDTIESAKRGVTPPFVPPPPRTPPQPATNRSRKNENIHSPTKAFDATRNKIEEPLDLCLNMPHSPLHYTALMPTRSKNIGLNEIGHIDVYDLVQEQGIGYGRRIETSSSLSVFARDIERKPLANSSPLSMNKCKQGRETILNCDTRGQIYPFNVPNEMERQYSSPPSIVEVAIALKDNRAFTEANVKPPSIAIEEILGRKGSTIDSITHIGDNGNEVIDIKKPRPVCTSQTQEVSDDSDKDSLSDIGSITEPMVEEERCLCLKACWKATLFFFFNVRS